MQGQVSPNLVVSLYSYVVVYLSMMKCRCASVGSLSMMDWRRRTLLWRVYKTKCDVCLFPEMPFNTDTPNSTMSESDI